MKLWTIQPIEILEEINEKGYFCCNETKAENITGDFSFKSAYDWLVPEMEKRIGKKPNNINYPIWAWHTRDWKRKKPDLRFSAYDKKGTKCVCLEIEIPDNEVVLSDFSAWHFVLNNMYLDDSKNEFEWDKYQKEFNILSQSEQEIAKRNSWQKIFNVTPIKTDWIENGRFIQATFWKLKKENIRKIQYFTAR